MTTKNCKTCLKEKPTSDFYTRSDSERYFKECKKCMNERAVRNRKNRRKTQEDHYPKQRESNRSHYAKNKERYRSQALKRRYGITVEDWYALYEEQEGKCAICEKGFPKERQEKNTNSLAVDHCHSTGKVRGLLCVNCNMAIGGLKDREDIMLRAIEYIKKSLVKT